MADVETEVLSPLADCFLHCEVACVRECCGIDAISTDVDLIAEWARLVGPVVVGLAIDQLGQLLEVASHRSHAVSCHFLNHSTATDEGREQILSFLAAFRTGLQAAVSS